MAKTKHAVTLQGALDILKLNAPQSNRKPDKKKLLDAIEHMRHNKPTATTVPPPPVLSNRLRKIRERSRGGKPVPVLLDRELALDLLLQSTSNRLLDYDHVMFWAFMYYSNIEKLNNALILDGVNNILLEGEHKLMGFLYSGREKIKAIIVFTANGTIDIGKP